MKQFIKSVTVLCIVISFIQAQEKTLSLAEKTRRFAPTEITGDVSKLSEGDKKALAKLIEASKLMDSIYLRQVWSGNIETLNKLKADNSPEGKERLEYFMVNMGPWSKLDHDQAYVDGVPATKFPGANYYPEDVTKNALEQWIGQLPEKAKKKATGFFWTIRKNENGLYAQEYSKEYETFLKPAAQLLNEAAELTTNNTLKAFLTKRAAAFLSNDYFDSDVAWMDLDSPIEPTIGPYEVYMDEMFNYKAAFESYITLKNEAESKKLAKFSTHLQEIENHLPIDKKYKNPKLGALSPIRVVDEVVIGGEARAGVQTAAFNLPNDENVVAKKGSKRVMLKNVQEAKFKKILTPISKVVLDPSQQNMIAFEPFFTHILAHELMHGLGPHVITVNGKKSTVSAEMKEQHSALEEAKADISGLFALQFLIDKGVVAKSTRQKMYVTYLASIFRSVRFGTNESHGKGTALQFNYLSDEGAFIFNEAEGTYKVDFKKIAPAVKKLTAEIMTLQAEGSYDKAKTLMATYGVIRPGMQKVLDKLGDVPVDIAPKFPLAEK
jgi:hypothetical protein